MITVSNVSLQFGGDTLFKNVNLQFNAGNCYGVIGANGAGKSTFLKILCGVLPPTTGEVTIPKELRMSVLKQDHFAYDAYTVLDTVIMGNERLYAIIQEKDALYAKPDFSEEDGNHAAELEAEFAELNGWEAESDVSKLLQGLGLSEDLLYQTMGDLSGNEKVKILLAQALFGNPDIILMDEPTNHLDIDAITWLEDFLSEYFGTVIVVSHDRHFLNNVCTHIVDIDYTQIKMYVGNYEFWYESSQMMQRMIRQQNKKTEEKIKELKTFIERFSANKSKSRQATSRRKLLDNLTVEQLPASSRRYPFIGFDMDRELGKEVLQVNGISKTVDGVKLLNNVSFTLSRTDKVAFIGESEQAITMLFKILMEEEQPDEGTFKWGVSTSTSYFPVDNSVYFNDCDLSILDWIRQYSKTDETETYLRGFLGRMLFSGDDIYKPVKVLSGGEKVRCMFSRMMLYHSNVLLLDRPTNHLDLESITAVNNGLTAFKGVVILSSHDHEILQTVANRIIEITPDGCLDRQGTYEEFLDWKKENQK
ncbi:MAG: ATP-binding cassette domain-containing protein [Ruminococcus sp.]|nr:ATP-binding cassette domain-containing protein [Ruminococcus sp.]MDY6145562.1 ATP-binding cassette domain-containing protein [Ruminococcus callidus]MCI7423157.1 ATP-binding cassette domain-containing protein [Ruminococcus sp.]MCI7494659.1 ATP-binding cassette domain-containing protein [Ruminococcus sp.]MDD6429607.1 ATP-binding cassette domain-containing protein [Ruminococcus sp.]